MNAINSVSGTSFSIFQKDRSSGKKSTKFSETMETTKTINEPVSRDNSVQSDYMYLKNSRIANDNNPAKEGAAVKSERIYEPNHYNGYQNREPGEVVFDLSKFQYMFENEIAFPEVEVFHQEAETIFRVYFYSPDSGQLSRVQVRVPKHEYEVPMAEEKFSNSIGKALMLMDKYISIKKKLGDVIPDTLGCLFNYDKDTNAIDLSDFIGHMKRSIQMRINGEYPEGRDGINYSASRSTLEAILKELEEFLLKLGIKN